MEPLANPKWNKANVNRTLGIVCLCMATYFFIELQIEGYRSNELITRLKLVLSSKPEIQLGGKSSSPHLIFNCENYDRPFSVGWPEYDCLDQQRVLHEFRKGDTISIGYVTEEANGMMAGHHIRIWSLEKSGEEFINPDCVNKELKWNTKSGILLALTIGGLFMPFKTSRARGSSWSNTNIPRIIYASVCIAVGLLIYLFM